MKRPKHLYLFLRISVNKDILILFLSLFQSAHNTPFWKILADQWITIMALSVVTITFRMAGTDFVVQRELRCLQPVLDSTDVARVRQAG